jgi:hypothetical protein
MAEEFYQRKEELSKELLNAIDKTIMNGKNIIQINHKYMGPENGKKLAQHNIRIREINNKLSMIEKKLQDGTMPMAAFDDVITQVEGYNTEFNELRSKCLPIYSSNEITMIDAV